MTRTALPFLALVAGLALAGCNETSGTGIVPAVAATSAAPSSFGLPPGAPCSAEIGRYDAVVKGDLSTGNVEQKVYDQIEGELSRAAAACAAGKGAEAHALVVASKNQHGYRA